MSTCAMIRTSAEYSSAGCGCPTGSVEVAGDLVTCRQLDERGLVLGAARHDERAAGMKVATPRRVDGTRHFTREHDLFPRLIGMRRQRGREQRLRVRMQWSRAQLQALGHLHELAQVHHGGLLTQV